MDFFFWMFPNSGCIFQLVIQCLAQLDTILLKNGFLHKINQLGNPVT